MLSLLLLGKGIFDDIDFYIDVQLLFYKGLAENFPYY